MKRHAGMMMVCLSAILVALSFWFENLGIVILVAFVPLFVVLLQEDSILNVAKYSSVFSLFAYFLLLSWLLSLYPMTFLGFNAISGLVIVFGWILFAIWFGIPMILCLLLGDGFHFIGLRKSLVMASLWTLMEWLLELGEMGFPWFRISLPLATIPVLAQGASIIGSLGLSFVVVFMNMSIASYLLQRRSSPKTGRSQLVWVALSFVVLCAYGIDRTQGVDASDLKSINLLSWQGDDVIEVALLQANTSSDEKWEVGNEWVQFDAYRDMTMRAIRNGAKLIVWPETAIPVALNQDNLMMEELTKLSDENGVLIVAGSLYEVNSESAIRLDQDLYQDGLYNGVYLFPQQKLYTKRHLVPIGEYMPRWMMNVLPLLRNFQLADQLSKLESSTLLVDGDMKIGSLICFESIFPSLSRSHVRDGANLLLIVSNDAWYSGSAEIAQHKNHAIFRAIESNRYVLRAGNTGISAIIDPRGNVMSSLGDNLQGVVYGGVKLVDKKSMYHEFPFVMQLVSIGVLLTNATYFERKRSLSLFQYLKYTRVR